MREKLTGVSAVGCQGICALALLLVGFSLALPIFGLALSPLFFPVPLQGHIVHALAPVLGEQPHSAVAMGASLIYDLAELVQSSEEAVEAFGVRDQRARGGGIHHVLKCQVAEHIEAQLDRLGLDCLEGRETGGRGRGARSVVAAPLLLLLLLADCAGAPLLPCPLLAR